MKKLVALALTKGCEIYIIPPPISELYKNFYNKKDSDSMTSYYRNLFTNTSHVHVYPSLNYYPKEQFTDSFHLAKEGSIRFTKEIHKIISE